MSDAESPDDPGVPDEQIPEPGSDFEPVDVFPDGDLDLREGADSCYKCSTCDTNCPVAEVDDEFPGPKFQGPEQWRLKRKDDEDIDSSIMDCSNCMRCDNACPSEVPLSQMHNEARSEYVSEQMEKTSVEYWRNRLLANYRKAAWLGSKFPRLSNFMLNNSLLQWVNEKTLGITSERDFPAFADQTFRSWWDERGGNAESRRRAQQIRDERGIDDDSKRIAYFHGCYSNYNTPEVAKALVSIFEYFGYEIAVPDQGCSGTPMFANGMLADARKDAEVNVSEMSDLIDGGYDVICSCTSCSMALKQEYPELFSMSSVEKVSNHTYEALEYLRIHEDLRGELKDAKVDLPDLAYHAPCHSRNQGLDRQAVELFRELDGVDIEDVGKSCSGISGTYGWKAEKYEKSMAIGEEMFEHMEDASGETGLTECPTCAMQMEHGTGYEIKHPLQVLEAALIK